MRSEGPRLIEQWDAEGVSYEERRADLSQSVLDEARGLGDFAVPIIVYPDGRVERRFGGRMILVCRTGAPAVDRTVWAKSAAIAPRNPERRPIARLQPVFETHTAWRRLY